MAKPATGTNPNALFGPHKADAQAKRAAVARPRRPLIVRRVAGNGSCLRGKHYDAQMSQIERLSGPLIPTLCHRAMSCHGPWPAIRLILCTPYLRR